MFVTVQFISSYGAGKKEASGRYFLLSESGFLSNSFGALST